MLLLKGVVYAIIYLISVRTFLSAAIIKSKSLLELRFAISTTALVGSKIDVITTANRLVVVIAELDWLVFSGWLWLWIEAMYCPFFLISGSVSGRAGGCVGVLSRSVGWTAIVWA